MPLRVKVQCVLFAVVGLVIALNFAVQRYAILPQLEPLEENIARNDLRRSVDVLRKHQADLESHAARWARSAESPDDVSSRERDALKIDKVDFAQPLEDSGSSKSSRLLATLAERAAQAGSSSAIRTEGPLAPAFVAYAPLPAPHENRGVLVQQYLDSDFLNDIYNEAGVLFQIVPAIATAPDHKEVVQQLRGGAGTAIVERNPELFSAFASLPNIDGQPPLVIRTDMSRSVYTAAVNTLHQGLAVQVIVGAVALLVLMLIFRATITKPLTTLTTRTAAIAPDGDLSTRINMRRRDEIGALADEFDRMVAELETDMVQRRAAETALRESEERYALAVQGANDGLWDWDLVNNTVYYSPRWFAMLGYEEGQLEGVPESWFGRVHPDDVDTVQAGLDAHLHGSSSHFECEFRMRHRAGKYVWVLCRGLAVSENGDRAYTRMAGSLTDISLRKVFEEQLSFQALRDPLTTLPNRLLFFDRLTQALKRSQRSPEHRFAVLYLDLDRFKYVNDGLGHVVGDTMLTEVADRIEAACAFIGESADSATVSRFGGDEFAVLLDDLRDLDAPKLLAKRIIDLISEPFHVENTEIFVTVSIGIAMDSPEYDSAGDIVRNADTAMFRAKAQGKGGYAVFDSDMHDMAMARLQIENDLRRAVGREEFVVYYQPIIDLQTGALAAVEALVRWRHPERGMVSPLEFTGVAEETGMIVPIGQFVLREACLHVKAWQRRYPGVADMKVSVNLSVREFTQPNLADRILQTLRDVDFPPQRLKLEITETVIMEGVDRLTKTLQALRDAGIELCIDDFGTGYSSLSYLHRFPMDTLKIDQAFVRQMHLAHENYQIVRTILTLANALNMTAIAEGIEDESQLRELRHLGCHYGQGYLFSKPLPPEDLDAFIERAEQSRPSTVIA